MKLNKKYFFLLLFITIIALFPRISNVFNPYNYFFNPEQGTEYLVTKSIIVDHKIIFIAHQGGFGGFFKPAGFNYILAIPFILADGDPFGGRLFMLIISVLTVPLAFIFANRIFGLHTASLIGFLLAISPNLKDYAGGISPPFVIPLLTVFFIYFLYKSFQKKFKYIPLLTLTVGLMMHFEMATAGTLIILLMLTAIVCMIRNTVPYRYYLISIGFFILTVLPIIIFDLQNNFYNTKGILRMIDASKTQTFNQMSSNVGNLITSRIDVFGWNFISTFSPNLIVWILVLSVYLLGLFLFIKDNRTSKRIRTFVLYIVLISPFSFLTMVFYPAPSIAQWWLIHLNIIYCFVFGIVINYLLDKTKFKYLAILMLLILSIAFINRTYFTYKTQFSYPPSTYIKEDQALKYIFNNSDAKSFGIVVLSLRPQKNYDYLIWWNGRKYNYQPYRIPKQTYYTIIEPNVTYSSNKTPGILIESNKMQNGFIVEKRIN